MGLATSARRFLCLYLVKSQPWSNHTELFHLSLTFSASQGEVQLYVTLADPLIFVTSVGTPWCLLPTSSWMQLSWHQLPRETPDPTLGLEWRNPSRSLLPASWEPCWALSCLNIQEARDFPPFACHF